ncbi:MAG: hypothetical protein ACI974_001423, partial [Paraglaciecola sp.]
SGTGESDAICKRGEWRLCENDHILRHSEGFTTYYYAFSISFTSRDQNLKI